MRIRKKTTTCYEFQINNEQFDTISDGKSNEIMTHAYRSNIQLDLTWSNTFFSSMGAEIYGRTECDKLTGNRLFQSNYSLEVEKSTENENF